MLPRVGRRNKPLSSTLLGFADLSPGTHFPWHLLYFLPLPQGHFALRPIFAPCSLWKNRLASQSEHVQAVGCSVYQLGLTIATTPLLGAKT